MEGGCLQVLISVFLEATHLPDDEEDEGGAQDQGEHVAEGRKGERHGCAGQSDHRAGERKSSSSSSLPASSFHLSG